MLLVTAIADAISNTGETLENNDIPSPKPVIDLSPRVEELARFIHHLPPGTYEITIMKPEIRVQDWNVEVVRTETIFKRRSSSYGPE
jgi:hypothetical protein